MTEKLKYCWIVSGTDSHGGSWMTRLCPGFDGIRTLKDAKSQAIAKAARMNAQGRKRDRDAAEAGWHDVGGLSGMTEQWDQDRMRREFPQLYSATRQAVSAGYCSTPTKVSPGTPYPLDELTFILPLPVSALSPNARVHWSKKAMATKLARIISKLTAINAMHPHDGPMWERAIVELEFIFRDKRRHDLDNALASAKAFIDGMTDAGVFEDDSGCQFVPTIGEPHRTNPRLIVTIRKVMSNGNTQGMG